MNTTQTFSDTLTNIKNGEAPVVGDDFLDWANSQGEDIRTVRNPNQVGTLDKYLVLQTVTRYAVFTPHDVHPLTGEHIYMMCYPHQGKNTFATEKEAQDRLYVVLKNNTEEQLHSFFGCDSSVVMVKPVQCYAGHFDPLGIYWSQK